MEDNTQDPVVQEPFPEGGPGARLVAAREAQGLTLAVVASKLRLSAATLQALESNRIEELPEPIFVRGYLRTYARLLELDQKVLVAEYDRLVGACEPVLEPNVKRRRQPHADYPYIRGALAMIVLAMLVLLGYWYIRLQHDVPALSQTASSGGDDPAASASESPSSLIDSGNQGPGPVAALPAKTLPQPTASEIPEGGVSVIKPEAQLDETAAAAEPVLPGIRESSETTHADTLVKRQGMESPVEPGVVDLPIAPLASEHGRLVRASRAPAGEDVLAIKANDESWADIVDANGYQLLYYPLRPGMLIRLQGQAPFQVFLGNAPAVDLSLNNNRFDHTRFRRRNNTARFTVNDDD